MCPFRCNYPSYIKAPLLVNRTIMELRIVCKGCNGEFTIEKIDKHEAVCQKLTCACYDCDVIEGDIKNLHLIDKLKFCSLLCKYTYQITTQHVKESSIDVSKSRAAVETYAENVRKTLKEFFKDSAPKEDSKQMKPYFIPASGTEVQVQQELVAVAAPPVQIKPIPIPKRN